ncbi:MAG: SusC/RagA family TonB-linked outer membrane protein [Bacteroidales bacterium]|jgi:iron complex outermembrane receptor protein
MFNFVSTEIRDWRRGSLTLFLLFLAFSLAFSQQKIVTDTIPSKSAEDEIVNIGYGTQKKREITSSIASLNRDEFNKGNIQNPLQLIQGKVAGLSINKPGGDPNGTFEVRLRGLNTIFGNLSPLIIVDGVIDASLNNVDPEDIESIDVLKDASAAAIYGTRGSGGVILVSTRRGKPGKTVIEYNVYSSAEMVAKNNPSMTAKEWRALSAKTGIGTDYGTSTDWFKEIEQTALSQVHNISMSGGTDKTSYRASINYRSGNGIMINTGYDQFNGRINITQKALNDKFILDLNMGTTQRESKYGFADAFTYASIYNPTAPVRSSDPEFVKYDGYFQQIIWDYYNPVSIAEENKSEGKSRILNLSLKATYEILKGLNVDAFYSVQTSGELGGQYFGKNDYWGGMNRNGLASRQEDNSLSRLFESTAQFNKEINSPLNLNLNLNLNLMGGYSYQDFTNEGFSAQGGDFLTDAFSFNNLGAAQEFKNGKGTITSYKNSNKLAAFFGRVNLNFNNRWFATASLRNEGSSRFGANNKWGLFPAFGTGVNIAKNISFIDNLKFRMDYGITGNQPKDSYLSLQILEHPINYQLYDYYTFLYQGSHIPEYFPSRNANPDLKWEKKSEFDAGIDFSLFKSRLTGSFDVYVQTASDILYQCFVSAPPNVTNEIWLNIGKIRSSGLELTLNYNVIRKSDLSYSITLSPSYNSKNILVSLSENYNGEALDFGTQQMGFLPGRNDELIKVEEGKPIGQIQALVFKGIDESGNLILVDQNNDGYIDQRDLTVVGNGLPKFLIGFGNMVTYKNWDLNVFFRGVFGHDLINSFRALYESPNLIISYNVPKTAANMITTTNQVFAGQMFSSTDIENASFVSLDNFSLGYSFRLPENSQISKIRVYLAGNNLFYITKYKGSDPNPRYGDSEYSAYTPLVPGIDRMDSWPRTRSFTVGANVVF